MPYPHLSNLARMAMTAAALGGAAGALSAAEPAPDVTLQIDLAAPAKPISPHLFGIFFEDLNYAADGGLYAELIQNRSFEYSPSERAEWNAYTGWELVKPAGTDGNWRVGDYKPVHVNNPHYLLLTVKEPGEQGVGIRNAGFDQIPVVAGKAYEASFWSYQAYMGIMWRDGVDQATPMPVSVCLEAADGTLLAEAKLEVKGRDWTQYRATLTPRASDPAARFVLRAQGQGAIALDMVSLFPHDTFKGRANGLRKDLAETIADLHPKFMRFPGGCLVHGSGVHADYDWKKSVGPLEQRQAFRNLWGYHQTLGLGYFEYFQFCEDIGAIPLPVVSAGVCCQHGGDSPGRGQEGLPMEEMEAYIQDIFDLIEWANGPADSKWGAVRAAAGHEKPFGLKYLGVGNEDMITPAFEKRFAMIYAALRERHPEIVVVGTSGPFASGEDYEKGWAFARKLEIPMVDEHYYVPPEWFWDNQPRYAAYDRAEAQVYVGEYAAHEPDRRNTWRSALAEAAGCISFENQGDIVHFASYAPMLARRKHTQWHPDLIYFDAENVYPSLNYEVQRIFGQNSGDALVPTQVNGLDTAERVAISVVRQSATGEVILKVVNGGDQPVTVQTHVQGVKAKSLSVRQIELSHTDQTVVNTDGQPSLVSPVVTTGKLAPAFTQTFPAYSVTVLRLK